MGRYLKCSSFRRRAGAWYNSALTFFATIFAKNYLAHARTLMDSVARFHPEARRVALLVDEPEGCFRPEAEDFEIFGSGRLPVPQRAHFFFKYTRLEASTALKPLFLSWLLEREGARRVIYLDPDIELYARLDPVEEALERRPYVLTPHLLRPDSPGQSEILRCGAFNLGFFAARPAPVTEALLGWWAQKTCAEGFVDFERGLFVDQRWMDLAPALFPEAGILRDAGCNVAWWNLAERNLSAEAGGFRAGGAVLRFFHFSGYQPGRPDEVSRFAPGLETGREGPRRALFDAHRRALLENGYQKVSSWDYTYSRFANGEPVTDFCRRIARQDGRWLDFPDPWSEPSAQRYFAYWTAPEGPLGMSRLMGRIYLEREDLQKAFPRVPGADERRFRDWFWIHGRREYAIPEKLAEGAVVPMRGDRVKPLGGYSLSRLRYMLDVLDKRLKKNS